MTSSFKETNKPGKGQTKLSLYLTTAMFLGAVTSGNAYGQSAPAPMTQDGVQAETPEADTIFVTGIRASLAASLNQKRLSDSFVDTLVAEDIAKFPDLNITEGLQRLPGVAIERQQGEGRNVTVRSLAPEFTQVRLNGHTVTAAGGRDVELDIFASEVIQNVTLTKTPYAALTEGGLAATIDLRTRRPFDRNGLVIGGSLQAQQNSLVKDWDPRGSFLVSNTWGDKFGALFSLAYSDYTLRQDAAEIIFWQRSRFGRGTLPAVEAPFLPRSINELRDRERLGLTAAFQWRPTSKIDVNLDIAHAKFEESRRRYTIDILFFDETPSPISATSVPGIGGVPRVTGGSYSGVQTRSENVFDDLADELTSINLDADWQVTDDLSIKSRVGYSKAEQFADLFRVLYDFRGNASFGFTQYRGVTVPTLKSDSFSFTNPNDYRFNQLRYLRDLISDEEASAQIDLVYRKTIGPISHIRLGGRFADHQFDRISYDQRINPSVTNPAPTMAQISSPNFGLFGGKAPAGVPSQWLVIERANWDAAQKLVPSDFVPARSFPTSFGVGEETLAAYLQGDVDAMVGGKVLRGNVGVRAVQTKQQTNGFALIGGQPRALTAERDYTDVLPSLNLVLELNDKLLVRAAASRAITRPTISQLSPGLSSVDIGSLRATQGNPELDPFRVNQADLGLEWYFSKDAILGITAFHKDVESFITTTSEQRVIAFGGPVFRDDGTDVSQRPFSVSLPINGKGAKITGVELSYQQPFSFLPIQGFGAIANYTFADSEVSFTYNGVAFNSPFLGSSRHSYNLVGYFENERFQARLAYAWRQAYLENRRGDNQSSLFIEDYGQLDLSLSYKVTKHIELTFDALNLTNEVVSRYGATPDRPIGAYEAGRFLFAGVQFSF